jgi:hypothetical protein
MGGKEEDAPKAVVDATAIGLNPPRERSPCIHDFPALLEHVAAPLGRLHFVPDRMGESHLGDFARKRGALGRPIAERGPEAGSLLWLSSIQ